MNGNQGVRFLGSPFHPSKLEYTDYRLSAIHLKMCLLQPHCVLGTENHETCFSILLAGKKSSISFLGENPSPQKPKIDFLLFILTDEFGRNIVVQSRTGQVRLRLVGSREQGRKQILFKKKKHSVHRIWHQYWPLIVKSEWNDPLLNKATVSWANTWREFRRIYKEPFATGWSQTV